VGRYLLRRLVTLTITLAGIMVMTFFTSLVVPLDPSPPWPVPRRRPRPSSGCAPLRVRPAALHPVSAVRGPLAAATSGSRSRRAGRLLQDILTYFPATLELATFAIFLGICVGIPLGVLSAVYKNRFIDQFLPAPQPGRRLHAGVLAGPGPDAHLLFQARLAPEPGRLDIMLIEPPRVVGVLLIDSVIARDWRCSGTPSST